MTVEIMQRIIENFKIDGKLIHFEPFGSGHINTTYVAYFAFENKPTLRYIIQKINTTIFKQPEKLIDNIFDVTEFLKEKIKASGGDENRETLSLIENKNGTRYYKEPNGDFYRAYNFIEDATCYQTVTPELFYSSAKAFGKFAKELNGFDPKNMFDTIENFHNTADRYKKFEASLEKNASGRAKDCAEQIEFIKARKDFTTTVLKEIESGAIPLRVCHNDTKLNNVMMDRTTGEGICVIDLDTVMNGSLLYDFGDSIRFGASSAAEDETDLDLVYCDLAKYETYVKGYLETCQHILSEKEFELLAEASILMTFECGMRFLTDYLDGDVYFRIHRDSHNLDRARNQFKLVADMESKLSEMKAIQKKYKQ